MRWHELADELAESLGRTEAGFVLEAVTARRPSALFANGDDAVDPAQIAKARAVVERVRQGEPLQHVLGSWGFRSLDLRVDARALIPRPETEGVVELALAVLDRCGPGPKLALDLGVGSGAIALALVAEREELCVIGVDRSPSALALAAENRELLGDDKGRVGLVAGEWYSPLGPALERRCALIVSNPPYLSMSEWAAAPPVVRDWDPYEALVAGPVGTESITEVVAGAQRYLVDGGSLVLEMGATQGRAVTAIGEAAGAAEVRIERDLAGRDRMAIMRW